MADITIYTTSWCSYCDRAKAILERHGLAYDEVQFADDDFDFRHRLLELTGGFTVPQIVVDGTAIGGSDELWRMALRGELDALAEPA